MAFRIFLISALMILGGSSSFASPVEFPGGCRPDLGQDLGRMLKTAEGGCMERETGIVWSLSGPITSYERAVEFCNGYNAGPWKGWQLASLEDIWRVVDGGMVSGMRLARLNEELIWTRDLASDSDNEHLVYVSSLMDADDYSTREADGAAATLCVRQSARWKRNCKTEDSDGDFVSADGGCMHRRSGKVYSAVFEAATFANAIRQCERLDPNSTITWKVALSSELEPLHGLRSASDYIHNLDWGTSVWVGAEGSGSVFVRKVEARGRLDQPVEFKIMRKERFHYTINVFTGIEAERYVLEDNMYVTYGNGVKPTEYNVVSYGLEAYETYPEQHDVSSETAKFLCVRI